MKITIETDAKEIAALVVGLQERQIPFGEVMSQIADRLEEELSSFRIPE